MKLHFIIYIRFAFPIEKKNSIVRPIYVIDFVNEVRQ